MQRRDALALIASAFDRLARAQIARPGVFVLLSFLLAIVATGFASRLELRTRFEQLLPEGRSSVVELERLHANVRSGSHVFVVVEGGDIARQRAFGDELARDLAALGPPWVVDSEDGVHQARAFLMPRAGAFAKLEDVRELRDDVEAQWNWEVGERIGLNLEDAQPPRIDWDEVKKRFDTQASERFPDGYYQSRDGRALVVVANTAIAPGDLAGAREALARIRGAAERAQRAEPYRALRMSFAGDLVTGLAEYGAVKNDLVSVGVLGVSLVLAVLFLFFMRVRALVALGSTILIGLAWTFGMTEIFIGHLNVATGFLVSIVAGNGINFGIIYMARFFEERRNGLSVEQAIGIAHLECWPSTLTAALAAAAAYGSLAVSEFRAFRHFAFIGGAGMVLCWLATYAVLPPLLLIAERVRTFGPTEPVQPKQWLRRLRYNGLSYAIPFAAVVRRAPRALAVFGGVAAVAGLFAVIPYVRSDPLEYNMRRMQNDLGDSAEMYRSSKLASEILGADIDGSMVMLADRADQVPMLKRSLEARRDAAPPNLKPFEAVHTIFDFVPSEQSEKLPLLEEIRSRVERGHQRGAVSDADFAKIRDWLPPPDLRPWSVEDLPEAIARPFTDKHGVRGRLALIEPTAQKSDSDLKYLMRWADSFREVALPNGEVIRGSGRAVIFADMLKTVIGDIPRSIALSFTMTVLAVAFTFRRGAHSLAVIGALLVGLSWLVFLMFALKLKINFFNFIALPISFGIGVDYAVNYMQRYDRAPEEGALAALRSTGGAVILCSLTTMLGYLALLGSINQAMRSLGLLAVLGELVCLGAAVLVLPALLFLRERTSLVPELASDAEAAPETP